MGDKIRGLTATSQRTQSSRDGQGGDAKKYGPGFSLTSRLRDFDFHPIARIKGVSGKCFVFVFFGGKLMRISNHEYATTNAGCLGGNIEILEWKQY